MRNPSTMRGDDGDATADDARPALARGVRLRRDADGIEMLVIPEGVLMLNATAAATLALVDGSHTIGEIVTALRSRFDVSEDDARAGVASLLRRLDDRRLLRR